MLTAALGRITTDLAQTVAVAHHGVHRGIFDAAELARASLRAPALLVHCAGLRAGEYAGGDAHEYRADLTLYLIARDRLGSPRLEQALDELVQPLLGAIPGREWGGPPWSSAAGYPTARSLYSATIDQQGLALWAIEWDQLIRLPRVRAA